jgi:hypothetical protein
LAKAIDAHPADEILRASDDQLVAEFADRFRVEAPVLTEGAMSVAAEETQVDVSQESNRHIWDRSQPFYVPGLEVTYYVPFTGDPQLFQFRASTYTFNPPRADVVGQELRFRYTRTDSDVAATKVEFERELANVRQHLSWIANDASMYNNTLVSKIRSKVQDRRARLEKKDAGMQALGIPVRRLTTSTSSPAHTPSPSKPKKSEPVSYDVALSFAGENRSYVEKVAGLLRSAGVSVFYDGFETATLWGKNLIDHLAEIYRHRSKFVVMFVSEHYVKKAFPTHERQHAQERALLAKEEYILPARFDDTEVPGMTSTVAYVDLRTLSPAQLVELILQKIGRKP